MHKILSVALAYFFALLLVCGALLTLFISIFSLGSQEQIVQQLQQDGFFWAVCWRFSMVGIVGLVLALATATISLIFRQWHRPGSWAAPKTVFRWAAVLNLLCALAGCVAYAWPALSTPLAE
ncbi:MAG: hypothetical protein EOO60_13905 [Hymenobacter sp.]|nr:MAG: hypothetical protein EOO60_13905 [Hymenobacter sp.]